MIKNEDMDDQFQIILTRDFSHVVRQSIDFHYNAKSNLSTVVESLCVKTTRFLSEQEAGSSNDDLIAASTSTNIPRKFSVDDSAVFSF